MFTSSTNLGLLWSWPLTSWTWNSILSLALQCRSLVSIGIRIGSFCFFKHRVRKFCNRRTDGRTDGRHRQTKQNIMPPASLDWRRHKKADYDTGIGCTDQKGAEYSRMSWNSLCSKRPALVQARDRLSCGFVSWLISRLQTCSVAPLKQRKYAKESYFTQIVHRVDDKRLRLYVSQWNAIYSTRLDLTWKEMSRDDERRMRSLACTAIRPRVSHRFSSKRNKVENNRLF